MKSLNDHMTLSFTLNKDYEILKRSSFKFYVIVMIIKQHENVNVRIMSSFIEITLIIKRVSLFFARLYINKSFNLSFSSLRIYFFILRILYLTLILLL